MNDVNVYILYFKYQIVDLAHHAVVVFSVQKNNNSLKLSTNTSLLLNIK